MEPTSSSSASYEEGGLFGRLRTWLFGSTPRHGGAARRIGVALIRQIAEGGVHALDDDDLMSLTGFIATTRELRIPLRGNRRFIDSVTVQYLRKRKISPAQRQAVLNILERAYPHNLAAELRRFA